MVLAILFAFVHTGQPQPFHADLNWYGTQDVNGPVFRAPQTFFRGSSSVAIQGVQAQRISLAELTCWRSPRGLDYREKKDRLTIWPYDHSGIATIDLTTGKCSSAWGCLSALESLDLKVTRAHKPGENKNFASPEVRPVFDASGVDVLVPVKALSAYLEGFARLDADSATLIMDYFPAATKPIVTGDEMTAGVGPFRPENLVRFEGHYKTKSGLEITEYFERCILVGPPRGTVRDEIFTRVQNPGHVSKFFQAYRVAPVYGHSLPCIFTQVPASKDGGLFDFINLAEGDFSHRTNGINGPSCLVRPFSEAEFENFAGTDYYSQSYTVSGESTINAKRIKFRYSEGHGSEFFYVYRVGIDH